MAFRKFLEALASATEVVGPFTNFTAGGGSLCHNSDRVY